MSQDGDNTRQFRLKKTLLAPTKALNDLYTYVTREEIDAMFAVAHPEGEIYYLNTQEKTLEHPEHGTIGIDVDEPNADLWEEVTINPPVGQSDARIDYLAPLPIDSDGGHCD